MLFVHETQNVWQNAPQISFYLKKEFDCSHIFAVYRFSAATDTSVF